MILSYSSAEQSQSAVSMDAWLAKLQEGKKSTQQLQSELLNSTTEIIKDIQDKALEKAKEEKTEEQQKGEEAVEVAVSSMSVSSTSDVPETTSEDSSVDVKA
ncbi:MAG: hypothetical protein KHX03_09060 [Clostridium sp.]|nr:hypothetical protein [Clostridium sp.]